MKKRLIYDTCKFNLDWSFNLHFCCLRPQMKFAVKLDAEEASGSSGGGELALFSSWLRSGFCSEAAGVSRREPPSASLRQPLHSPQRRTGLLSAPSQNGGRRLTDATPLPLCALESISVGMCEIGGRLCLRRERLTQKRQNGCHISGAGNWALLTLSSTAPRAAIMA